MTAESKEVAIQLLYIYLHVGRTLGTVYQHRHSMLVGNTDNLLNGIDGSQHIAYMCHTNDTRTVGKEFFIFFHPQSSVICNRNYA